MSSAVVMVSLSAGFAIDAAWLRLLVVALGAFGVWFVLSRPTREAVVEAD